MARPLTPWLAQQRRHADEQRLFRLARQRSSRRGKLRDGRRFGEVLYHLDGSKHLRPAGQHGGRHSGISAGIERCFESAARRAAGRVRPPNDELETSCHASRPSAANVPRRRTASRQNTADRRAARCPKSRGCGSGRRAKRPSGRTGRRSGPACRRPASAQSRAPGGGASSHESQPVGPPCARMIRRTSISIGTSRPTMIAS